jgi:hypothetical protein
MRDIVTFVVVYVAVLTPFLVLDHLLWRRHFRRMDQLVSDHHYGDCVMGENDSPAVDALARRNDEENKRRQEEARQGRS